ncbi:DUF2589 domain-containing protein [Elizabethkingia bruuniana]|uniref:DUF2589 domain-containing protein n=1 Tax=Elizabethkingia bruuniana TaxID=1756149 RepID=A0A7T7ZZA7_9FLAO|nr:DUF2589 domain-containing protein [Elizabethkingia bruuniana]KGO09692.1 hypothetical protein KS04_13350 [Elizabethkingia miricola]AQX85740.1 hypothetical protein AYC65_12310 [Elizabethkingia bruuniana]KUY22841.1 hypothetical protein ATB97_11655 [Elizabethkingia bruuniana]OPB68714.1 hypothetical protein BAY12_00775 [Elizabethkingia bruuniana]QDZ61909.1 DUF2589 domain-containing protein [Elizabethkingia bruuniana]
MDDQLLSIAQQFSGLPIDSLIGGPLLAAAKANANMAYTQTQFLLDTCFNKDDKTNNYTPIIINMELQNNAITPATDGKDAVVTPFTTIFNLPILTIIPLNSLAVDNVDVDFEMEVKSSFSQDTNLSKQTDLSGQGGFEAKVGWGPLSVTVHGSVSYDSKESSSNETHYQKSNSAKYSVKVHAGQLPLPQGVLTIIEAYSKNITPIQMPVPTTKA